MAAMATLAAQCEVGDRLARFDRDALKIAELRGLVRECLPYLRLCDGSPCASLIAWANEVLDKTKPGTSRSSR